MDSIQNLIKNTTSFAKWKLPFSHKVEVSRLLNQDGPDQDLKFIVRPFFNPENKKEIEEQDIRNNQIDSQNTTTKEDHILLVEKAIKHIKTKICDKVIISRVKTIPRKTDISLDVIFDSLCKKYENAFVYIFHHPKYGTWMGASPELLLSKEKGIIKTVALAGTQKINTSTDWQKKEIEEHQYVIDAILSNINKTGTLIEQKNTKTEPAGLVQHLKTEFTFKSKLPTHKILKHFHPTPAVCGTPTKEALNFIKSNEPHNRKCYTGYIGVKSKNAEHYFVNLRCMQVTKDNFILYVGGGITESSDPEKEWEETENKAQTLLSVIQNC